MRNGSAAACEGGRPDAPSIHAPGLEQPQVAPLDDDVGLAPVTCKVRNRGEEENAHGARGKAGSHEQHEMYVVIRRSWTRHCRAALAEAQRNLSVDAPRNHAVSVSLRLVTRTLDAGRCTQASLRTPTGTRCCLRRRDCRALLQLAPYAGHPVRTPMSAATETPRSPPHRTARAIRMLETSLCIALAARARAE